MNSFVQKIKRVHNSFVCSDTTYKIECFTTWEEVPATWDHLAINYPHLLMEQLKVFECSQLNDIDYRYLLLRKEEKPVAIAYFQILHFRRHHYKSLQCERSLVKHLENAIINRDFCLWVCGNLFRADFNGISFNPKETDLNTCIEQINDYANQIPRKERPTLFLLKDMYNKWESLPALRENGFKMFPEDIVMKMEIKPEWKALEDYRQDLSKKYATRVSKTIKEAEGIERRELSLQDLEYYGDRIQELYEQVMKKQTIRLGILHAYYFQNCKKCAGNDFRVFGYFNGDKMVAFTSNILKIEEWEIHYIGIDYEYNAKHKLYLNILLDGLSNAISSRKSTLNVGRTAKEAKAILGCKPHFYQNYYKVRGAIPKLVFRFLENRFTDSEGDEWKIRNPFKENTVAQN